MFPRSRVPVQMWIFDVPNGLQAAASTPNRRKTRAAMLGIGMAHVEGALQGSDLDPARGRLMANPLGKFRGDFVGHIGQAGVVHAELHAVQPGGLHGIQPRLQRGAPEGPQEDADLDERGILLGGLVGFRRRDLRASCNLWEKRPDRQGGLPP